MSSCPKLTYVQNSTKVSRRLPNWWKCSVEITPESGSCRSNNFNRITAKAYATKTWPDSTITAKIVECHSASIDMIQSTNAKVAVKGRSTTPGPLNRSK